MSQLTSDQQSTVTKARPTIELAIRFENDSDSLSPAGVVALAELGEALSSPELKGSIFQIAGHTNGRKSDEDAQKLSEQRAAAVKQFLMEKFNIPSENLVTVGYGRTQPKAPENPLADENDRIQVVHMESK